MIEWCFISVIADVTFNGEAYISSRSTSTEDSFADNHDGGSSAKGTLVEDSSADNQDGGASASCSYDRDIDDDSSGYDVNTCTSDSDNKMTKSESDLVEKSEQPEIQEEGISIQSMSNKYGKQHACLFCGKLMGKIVRHLLGVHRKKPEIVRVLSLKKGSSVRRNLLDNLRNRGNFKHNSDVLKNGKGVIIPKYRPWTTISATSGEYTCKSLDEYVHCQYCKAMLIAKAMPLHSKTCSGLKDTKEQSGHVEKTATKIRATNICATKIRASKKTRGMSINIVMYIVLIVIT